LLAAMAPNVKKGTKKKASKKEDKVGPLAGRIKDSLPAALDLSTLVPKDAGSDESSDDEPPEEVASGTAPVGMEEEDDDDSAPEEVTNERPPELKLPGEGKEDLAQKKKTRRGRKTKAQLAARAAGQAGAAGLPATGAEDDEAEEDQEEEDDGKAPIYEDPENRALLESLRDEDERRRERRRGGQRIEKNGFVLTLADAAGTLLGAAAPDDAKDFLQKEMFQNRKRKRKLGEKNDRGLGAHLVRQIKNQKKKVDRHAVSS